MDDALLIEELVRVHAAHTLILYGSRARGDATAESDVDVAAFADVDTTRRDARLWRGLYLDGFVYPSAMATTESTELLKLVGGRVLLDERGLAGPLLERISAADRAPVEPASADHCQMLRVWAQKTLARISRGDIEAHYRRHWLLFQLLEDYFTLRAERYRGPKLALAALQRDTPLVFAAFERALEPNAPVSELGALVALVDVVTLPRS